MHTPWPRSVFENQPRAKWLRFYVRCGAFLAWPKEKGASFACFVLIGDQSALWTNLPRGLYYT